MSVYSQAYDAIVAMAADRVADLVSSGQDLIDAARRLASDHQVEPLDVLAAYEMLYG